MKIIIYTLVPVIILALLNNKGILPNTIYYILLIIVALIGAYFFWIRIASIIMRDNMNYQEYNWYFDPNAAPSGTASSTDPWLSNNMPGSCIGRECCSDGQIWDSTLNQCVGDSTVVVPTVTESFITETMVNNALTKKQHGKHKPDVNIGNIHYNQSQSFINNSKI